MSGSKKKVYDNWKIIHKGMETQHIESSFKENLEYALSKDQYTSTVNDNFLALAIAIRDRVVERWIVTQQNYHHKNGKRVYYLSMEFLIGRLLGNYIYNLGLEKNVEEKERQTHWPTLNTVIMVEETLKRINESVISVAELKRKLPSLDIIGADVVVQPKTYIPVTKYDGATLPFGDNFFDVVIFSKINPRTEALIRVLLSSCISSLPSLAKS